MTHLSFVYCVSKNFAARCEMPRDTARSLSKNSRLEFLEFQKFLPGSFIITLYGFCFWSLSLFVVHPSFSAFLEFLKILKNSQKWEIVQTTGRVELGDSPQNSEYFSVWYWIIKYFATETWIRKPHWVNFLLDFLS